MIDLNSPREKLREAIIAADRAWSDDDNNKEFADLFLDRIFALYPNFAGVLDGTHVIVPKEPTQKMLTVAAEAFECLAQINPDSGYDEEFTVEYRAMIEAVQEQP